MLLVLDDEIVGMILIVTQSQIIIEIYFNIIMC